MKSQIQVFTIVILFITVEPVISQPKISSDFGFGFYEPTMEGFDENSDVPFPTGAIYNRNMLVNWSIYYEFFSNARIGYNLLTSIEVGELELTDSHPVFWRTIRYNMFPLETFFRWRPKIELNFTLAPIWGRGKITVETTPSGKTDNWNELLNSFGDSDPMDKMGSTDAMLNDWYGYSGMIGIRYYYSSRIGFDFKAGFLNNSYNEKNWRLYKKDVVGPKMKIDSLPLFSFKVVYGLK